MDLLKSMEVFLRVVEHGSFRQAAKACKLSPGMVSTHIAQLEQRLGIQLIDRKVGGLALTEQGAVYHEHCRHILLQIGETETLVTDSQRAPRGHLRIEVSATIARTLIVPVLGDFFARYPNINLEFVHTDHVLDSTYRGYDVMIRIGPLADSNLIARPLRSAEVWTVAAPEYLAKHGEPASPEDLMRHQCISYIDPRSGRVGEWVFERGGERISIQVPGKLTFNEGGPRFEAALCGLGIIQSTTLHIGTLVSEGRLQRVLHDWTASAPQLLVLYSKSRYPSAKVHALVEFLLEMYPADK